MSQYDQLLEERGEENSCVCLVERELPVLQSKMKSASTEFYL